LPRFAIFSHNGPIVPQDNGLRRFRFVLAMAGG